MVYDCWFPATKGGAERWLDELASRFVDIGHDVDYVTCDYGSGGEGKSYKVVPVGSRFDLYHRNGTRKTWPALKFSVNLWFFLLKNRRTYDLVYVAQSPLWPVIAASLALMGRRIQLVVEWLEWWPLPYWKAYSGRLHGALGYLVQRFALALSPRLTTYTDITRSRLLAFKSPEHVVKLPGMLRKKQIDGDSGYAPELHTEPLLLFVGRLVPDKRPQLALEVMASVVENLPSVQCAVVGEGPLLDEVRDSATSLGLRPTCVRGGVSDEELSSLWKRASVLLHPSAREGYGLVVLEACAAGTPVIVAESEDNAAMELVIDQVNGIVAKSTSISEWTTCVNNILNQRHQWSERAYRWFSDQQKGRSSLMSAQRILMMNGHEPDVRSRKQVRRDKGRCLSS